VAESFFASPAGAPMYVEDRGDGPPVLTLHGLGGGAWFFSGLAERLSPRYRVLSLDLPGTGRSAAGAAGFSVASWITDLGELLSARVAGPVVLVGHSLGTILALEAWDAWPERIRALVFVGGLPEPRPLIRERLSQRAEAVAAEGLAGWGPKAASANFARATLDHQPEVVAMFERLFETQDAASYVRCCGILLSASATAVVPTVTVPCLAISGAEDQYAPPELVKDFVRALPEPCRHEVMPDCGHLPFLEAPAAFGRLLRGFLDSVC
jgi:3-oxoadipate enol-lactonase